MINNLWILPLLILLNLLIGQFKELRIKEILRFNSIIGNKDNAQK
jgi:hypothetical protein